MGKVTRITSGGSDRQIRRALLSAISEFKEHDERYSYLEFENARIKVVVVPDGDDADTVKVRLYRTATADLRAFYIFLRPAYAGIESAITAIIDMSNQKARFREGTEDDL